MRSAQLTTSPSGVAGAGRDQEWLRTPSSVSVQRLRGVEHHVGPPHGVVVAPVDVGSQRVLRRVPAGAVAAVVGQGDRLGERDVQAQGPGDRRRHLGDLERVGEAGALVVVGEDEDLRLPGESPEGAGVQDPVTVALEAGAQRVGRFGEAAMAAAPAAGRTRRRGAGPRAPRAPPGAACAPGRRWRGCRRGRAGAPRLRAPARPAAAGPRAPPSWRPRPAPAPLPWPYCTDHL